MATGAPGSATAGSTTTRVCSWALAPYASHQARWTPQRANGVAHGEAAASASQVDGVRSRRTGGARRAGCPGPPGDAGWSAGSGHRGARRGRARGDREASRSVGAGVIGAENSTGCARNGRAGSRRRVSTTAPGLVAAPGRTGPSGTVACTNRRVASMPPDRARYAALRAGRAEPARTARLPNGRPQPRLGAASHRRLAPARRSGREEPHVGRMSAVALRAAAQLTPTSRTPRRGLLVALLAALLAAGSLAAAPSPASAAGIKVVIVVGPAGSRTRASTCRSPAATPRRPAPTARRWWRSTPRTPPGPA